MPGATSSILANLANCRLILTKHRLSRQSKAVDDLMSQLTVNANAVADPKF